MVFLWKFLFTNRYSMTCVFPSVLIFLINEKRKEKLWHSKRADASREIKGRVSGEFWWGSRSKISKNHRLLCSPSTSNFVQRYKRMFTFFVIVSKLKYSKRGYPFVPTVIYCESTSKIYWKTLFVSAGFQKRWKTGFWVYFTAISTKS